MKPYMNPTPHLSCHREPRGERDPPLPSSPTGESSDVLPGICPTTRLTFFPPILLQSLPPSSSVVVVVDDVFVVVVVVVVVNSFFVSIDT